MLSVAEGTVYKFCTRVIHALRKIKHEHIWWPGPERRDYIKRKMEEEGFPGCIGIVDGTLFRLSDKPKENRYAYWQGVKFRGIPYRRFPPAVPDGQTRNHENPRH